MDKTSLKACSLGCVYGFIAGMFVLVLAAVFKLIWEAIKPIILTSSTDVIAAVVVVILFAILGAVINWAVSLDWEEDSDE